MPADTEKPTTRPLDRFWPYVDVPELPTDAELLLTNAPEGPRLEAWEARIYRRGA